MDTRMADTIQSAIFDAWAIGCVGKEVVDYVLSVTEGNGITEIEVNSVLADMFNTMKD